MLVHLFVLDENDMDGRTLGQDQKIMFSTQVIKSGITDL